MRRAPELLAAAFAAVVVGAVCAQPFPARPIRIVVGFPPGGGVDVLARALGPQLTMGLGQQIVVDNRSGAGGTLASELVARATPDGHTLVLVSASHAVTASISRKLPFDPVADFTAIGQVASSPNVLLAHPEFSARSVADLVRLARSSPGAINYASGGIGTTGHLSAELLNMLAGIQLVHVPYKGNPLALADLISGRVQLMVTTVPTAITQIKAGRVRALAVTSAKRFSVLPEVPTVAESGVRDYASDNWFGVLGPRGVHPTVVSRLNAELVRATAHRETAEAILRQGAEPLGSTPAEFGAYVRAEILKWTKTVQTGGIQSAL